MARVSRNYTNINDKGQYSTALYLRLSRDDGDKLESDSIINQRDMLLSYIEAHTEFKLYDIYIDDGYTGTNFNRPNFIRMIDDMKNKKISCIIVKDLSRFGRDYIEVGNYLENVFEEHNVRFIAINENVDSQFDTDVSQGLIIPFTNIMNTQYARDISKKVRSALDSKRNRGEFIGSFACYGYMKDPNNKNKLIIDYEAAETVKKIFSMFLSGMAKLSIAHKLDEFGIPCPSEYKRIKGLKYINSNRLETTTYWTHTSIHRILRSEMYIGNMVQKTQTTKNYKSKQNIQLDKSQWIVVQNTHEPIIDSNTWETSQRLLQTDIKKSQYTGEIHLFAGLIKCGDCGRAMKKRITENGINEYYICGTYMAYGKTKCTNHSIRMNELNNLVFEEIKAQIKKYADFNKIKGNINFIEQTQNQLNINKKLLLEFNMKLDRNSKMKQSLYENYVEGVLSRDEYMSYKTEYEKDIGNLHNEIKVLSEKINDFNFDGEYKKSADLILKYQNADKLTRELLVSLVKSVIVYEDKSILINFSFNSL